MAIQESSREVYHQIVEYITQNPEFKVDTGHQNYFEISRGRSTCLVRIRKDNTVTVELYCNTQESYWVYYNVLELLSRITTPYQLNPITEDVGTMLDLLHKKILIDDSFRVPDDLEQFKAACCWLLDLYDKAAQVSRVRRFVQYNGGAEMTKEELLSLLSEYRITVDIQQELLRIGKIGITCPSGKPKAKPRIPLRACLWIDADYAHRIPQAPLADDCWSADWKPSKGVPPASSQSWVLVAAPLYWSFSEVKTGDEFHYSLRNENGNARQKPKCFSQIAPGDKVVCYEAAPTMALVAFAELVAPSDGDKIILRKTEDIQPALSRDELIAHSILRNPFESPQFSLSDITEAQYEFIRQMVDREIAETIPYPHNRIVSGAPGTGKSYTLKKEATSTFVSNNIERVTFHPEYSYFDFVGSYKPVMEGEGEHERIKYRFVPGPFAKMLRAAMDNPYENYLLVIEEINRARVAAVFGDIFQLLDRDENGVSEYGITPPEELRKFLEIKPGEKIALPANLYIWATMNSADQGVYPMDTAFKRRWSFEYQGLDTAEDAITGAYADTWKKLRREINRLLHEAGINEDKQMGPFFLSRKELKDEDSFKSAFKSKVLMYLYEDAAKHKRSHVFKKDGLRRYSDLCSDLEKQGTNADAILEHLFGIKPAPPTDAPEV